MATTLDEVKDYVKQAMSELKKEMSEDLIKMRIEPMDRQLLDNMRQQEEKIKVKTSIERKKEANHNKPKGNWSGEKTDVFTDLMMDMQVWAGSMSDYMWSAMLKVEQGPEDIDEVTAQMTKDEYMEMDRLL